MSKIVTIKPGEPDFVIKVGLTLTTRAGIQVSENCPGNYIAIIQKCMQEGWLKPIACMRDSELIWGALKDETN
jgi:hypothetical protein